MSINNIHKLVRSNIELIFLSILLVLGFMLRLYKIDNPVADWHSFRQVDTSSVTQTYLKKGVNLLYPRYHDMSTTQSGLFNPSGYRFVEFPIFNILHFSSVMIAPNIDVDVLGRLVSIASSLVSAILIYFIGKKYISSLGGLVASALFLISPFSVYFSRVILPLVSSKV